MRAHGRADRSKHVWTDTYSAVCHAPAAAEQRDFTSTCLCLTPTPPPTHTPAQYLSSTPVSLLLAGIYPSLTDLHRFSTLQRPHSYPPLLSSPLPSPVSTATLAPLAFHANPNPQVPPPPKGLDSVSDLSESHELTQALLDTHTLD